MKGDGGSMNNTAAGGGGFWDLPETDRQAAMEAACRFYEVEDFYDLDPEQRRMTYREAAEGASR